MAEINLIVRGDDTGGSISANKAVVECFQNGILRNTSVMGNCDFVEDAAERFKDCKGLCTGMHLTLNSEWDFPKFRPVLPAAKVPSLVDSNGNFLPSPLHLHERGFVLEEIMAEAQAQLERLRSHGIEPQYLDEHMGVGWLEGLSEKLEEFCEKEGLVCAKSNAEYLPSPEEGCGDSFIDKTLNSLKLAEAGRYVLVTHPLYDDKESQAITREENPPGEIAKKRDEDRRTLLDARLLELCKEPEISLIRYID